MASTTTSRTKLADLPNTPEGVAEYVAYMGHQGTASLTRRQFTSEVVDEADRLGLIQPVPRLGGWTAARKVTRKHLGARAANLGR